MTVLLQPRTSASGITPTLEDARELARHGNLIPVYRDFLADMETPVSVYDKVTTGPYSFLLESVEGGERLARYSFIGTEPRVVARLRDGIASIHSAGNPTRTEPFSDPLAFIRDLIAPYKPVALPDMPRFVGGVVGYLAYECARYFEKLPVPPRDDLQLPDAVMMLADTLVVFDHVKHRMRVLAHADLTAHGGDVDEAYRDALHRIEAIGKRLGSPGTLTPGRAPLTVPRGRVDDVPANVASTFTRHAYQDAVTKAREYVARGDIIQVVPSQRLSREVAARPFTIYRALRAVNPSPYMYYLNLDDMQIAGASPEMLVQVEDGVIRTRPIAGTRPRGADPEADDANAADLLADEKERAEHIMLVDLGRNDVGRVAKPGSVHVTDLMIVERYSHVMHIVSQVEGRLKEQMPSMRCVPASPPGPSLAPRKSGRWRSSPKWSPAAEARTQAQSGTSRSMATWTPPSRSARSSSRTVLPMCKPVAVWFTTLHRRPSSRRPSTRPRPCCVPLTSPRSSRPTPLPIGKPP